MEIGGNSRKRKPVFRFPQPILTLNLTKKENEFFFLNMSYNMNLLFSYVSGCVYWSKQVNNPSKQFGHELRRWLHRHQHGYEAS